MTLFGERAKKVTERVILEKEITDQNGKLVQQLQDLFKKIANKTKIGFHVKLMDESAEVSTEVFYMRKTARVKSVQLGGIRITLATIPIRLWLSSPDDFNSYLINIERHMRLLAQTSLVGRQKGRVSFSKPQNVTVSIETRNRYF